MAEGSEIGSVGFGVSIPVLFVGPFLWIELAFGEGGSRK